MRQVLGVNEALDRLVERDARGYEDRRDDRETGELLGAEAAQRERDAERNRRERVSDVVDQVGKEGDRAGEEEDAELRQSGDPEDAEADGDCLDSFVRANDRAVDEAMRVTVVGLPVPVRQWPWSSSCPADRERRNGGRRCRCGPLCAWLCSKRPWR